MTLTLAVLALFCSLPARSIHETEDRAHRAEATWAPVAERPVAGRPYRPRDRGMLRNYYGYMPYWIDTAAYDYLRMDLLTHIAYFSIAIDPQDGSLGALPNPARFAAIRGRGHDHGVRIHMTFTLFGSAGVRDFLNNAGARAHAVDNIAAFMTDYAIEGANLDFEFVTAPVRDSFTTFVHALAQRLWYNPVARKDLFLAMPAVPEWYPGYDFAGLQSGTDGYFIMTYDFHYSGSSNAGPVSPCVPSSFWGQYCALKTIASYRAAGVDPGKMVLGLPYYGYDWPTVSGNIGSATTGTGTAVTYYYAYQYAITYGRLWDDYSLTPWYRYYSTQWHQCWYDDTVSLATKFAMVNDSLLQGAGCWALGYDRDFDHIWNTIERCFAVNPPARHFTAEAIAESLYFRAGPDSGCSIIGRAARGSRFTAFDYRGNWYKAYYPSHAGAYYGWLAGGDGIISQQLSGATRQTVLRVDVDLLNVRTGPSTGYPAITAIGRGQVFVVDSINGDWARIHIPVINGHDRGWSCHAYATLMQNLEDFNPYGCTVTDLTYPATVSENDTFSIRAKVTDTGFGPFDALVYLKCSGPSPFYYPPYWLDSTRAKTAGFDGLPNQTFYRTAVFKAPDVPNNMFVSDTFVFERNNTGFGPPIIVSLTVIDQNIVENETRGLLLKPLVPTIGGPAIRFFLDEENTVYAIAVYDVLGRLMLAKNARGGRVYQLGENLASGVYFLKISTPEHTFTAKIVKLR